MQSLQQIQANNPLHATPKKVIATATVLCIVVLLCSPTIQAQELATNQQIEWALAYAQPKHKCSRPATKRSNEVAGKIARYQRKMTRFAKCVKSHQLVLVADHQRIVEVVRDITPTQSQAQILAEKLKTIEATIEELGSDVDISLNPTEVDRILRIGNRPSAT